MAKDFAALAALRKNTPDNLEFMGSTLRFGNADSVAFGFFNNKLYTVTDEGFQKWFRPSAICQAIHANLWEYINYIGVVPEGFKLPSDKEDKSQSNDSSWQPQRHPALQMGGYETRKAMKPCGRLWLNSKVMSFWHWPEIWHVLALCKRFGWSVDDSFVQTSPQQPVSLVVDFLSDDSEEPEETEIDRQLRAQQHVIPGALKAQQGVMGFGSQLLARKSSSAGYPTIAAFNASRSYSEAKQFTAHNFTALFEDQNTPETEIEPDTDEAPEEHEEEPLQGHPDLGMRIGAGRDDGTLEYRVLEASQRLQRGFPEQYATITRSLPPDVREMAAFAGGIRTHIYEHIGDLHHRAGSDFIGAMIPKIRGVMSYGGRFMSLADEVSGQEKNNAAYSIASKNKDADGNFDMQGAMASPEYAELLLIAERRNMLLDHSFAAMYSRLQAFTPMQAAGRNMAIAFGMRRYNLMQSLGQALLDFFDRAHDAGMENEQVFKLGFDKAGVNNLSRSNNQVAAQWATNLKIFEAYFSQGEPDRIVRQVRHQLLGQISQDDLALPVSLLRGLA